MTSYSAAIGDQRSYREFVHALVACSKQRLMTTFLNYENPELFGLTRYMPDFAVSSIVDNIILMSFVELGDRLRRAITVAKARGSDHQFITREFKIGPGGDQPAARGREPSAARAAVPELFWSLEPRPDPAQPPAAAEPGGMKSRRGSKRSHSALEVNGQVKVGGDRARFAQHHVRIAGDLGHEPLIF